jgi:hypothetical protein
VLLIALLFASPTFDAFDGALDPTRWYIGVAQQPARGVLRIPKGGWLVSRYIPDNAVDRIEVRFRGDLAVTFHDHKQPLAAPQGDPIAIRKGAGTRTLVLTRASATLDGAALPWKGKLLGTFRLASLKTGATIEEVLVTPRPPPPPEPGYLEKRTVLFQTTPPKHEDYARATLMLWDVEICFLVRRGVSSSFAVLQAPVHGAPVLAALVTLGTGKEAAAKAGAHPLAMSDWRDERGNLSAAEYAAYLKREYRMLELLQLAQRALNAATPEPQKLEALVHLAAIRHTANAHAAVALAETQKNTAALAALRKALKGSDVRRTSSDALRAAAGEAARLVLKAAPECWPGFVFDPKNRFVTIQQARDLSR